MPRGSSTETHLQEAIGASLVKGCGNEGSMMASMERAQVGELTLRGG